MHHRKLKVHSCIIKGYLEYWIKKLMKTKSRNDAVDYFINSKLVEDLPFIKFRIQRLIEDGFTKPQAVNYIKDNIELMRNEEIFKPNED